MSASTKARVSRSAKSWRNFANEPSEHEIAAEFARAYGKDLKFDHHLGRWFKWNGSHWDRDDTKLAFHFARGLAVAISAGDPRFSRSGVAKGAEAFARADPAHAVTSITWDRDTHLLGTSGGTVDLRTGKLRKSRRGDMITKQTAVAPAKGVPARWLQFLDQVTSGDGELIQFLKQICGYCLTGMTTEHAMFFIHGPGGNGKSVFVNILMKVLGDYAVAASMDTFTSSKNDRHPTDLAMLRGARLVSASETEEGRSFAESRIKQLTGGERISARYMRQDFFEYYPQFKIILTGNHAPLVSNVDGALKRRFNIIPFNYVPPRPDKNLEAALWSEANQILWWMIEGCLEWQARGLQPPKAVRSATADYFQEQDVFKQWIDEQCTCSPTSISTSANLYKNWCAFAQAAGEHIGSRKTMSSKLLRLGFRPGRRGGSRIYSGIALRGASEQRTQDE